MAATEIESWLRAKQRHEFALSSFYVSAAFAGGMIVLALNFGVFFLAAKTLLLLAHPAAQHPGVWSSLLAAIVTALLFTDCLRAERDDMSVIPLWLAREYIHIGPRLILDALQTAARTERFLRIDIEMCARVLAHLATKSSPLTREELLGAIPGLNWERAVSQLGAIEGVILFRPDARRVSLTMPLRLQLRQMLPRRKTADAPAADEKSEPVSVHEPVKLSACEILGVTGTASLAEIKAAYRSRIKECHPDHFANMDETSKRLAEEWTKALNTAYGTLTARDTARKQAPNA